jgi:predicted acyltransferase
LESVTITTQNNRLLALDVFRGMTIAFMILVNTPGSWSHVFSPLRHAKWHGATPTDMVFPFFLFIVGVSMFFSFSKYNQNLDAATTKKILKRVFLIFVIGLTLNYFPFYNRTLGALRIMGVLQRIALAYGLGAFICLFVPNKNLWKVGLLILVGYWGVMYAMGTGDPFSLQGNFAKVADLAIFGESHVYKGFGIPFDPEGLFSTIPAAVTVIFGYLVGLLIKEANDKSAMVKNLLIIGTLSIFIALVWDMYFPINKPLWTSSYVLYAGGIASIIIGLLIEFIDVRGYQSWTKPFVVFGMNPLIIYVMSGLIVKVMLYIAKWENASGETVKLYGWIYNEVFAGLLPSNLNLASLLFAIFIVSICWLFGYVLFKKRIFIKV